MKLFYIKYCSGKINLTNIRILKLLIRFLQKLVNNDVKLFRVVVVIIAAQL